MGLDRSDDEAIRRYAVEHGFAIVTKDADFAEHSLVKGAPPKVVWIRRGNCSTATAESLLRVHRAEIDEFGNSGAPLLRLLWRRGGRGDSHAIYSPTIQLVNSLVIAKAAR